MNQLDVYYRALLDYKKITATNNACGSLRSAIAESDLEADKIVTTRSFCTIDEDWVEAIEKGLVHIEKAIKEDRQFIRSNGEVVPIEKVKHVSKESVEHLAKHSNLITRYEEGEDIVPDKLYTVERLNDYAVYENRFLYMLLCYLRDFVTIRYNDILDIAHKYDATVDLDKKVTVGKQNLTYTLSMHDVRRDDPYLVEHNPVRKTIDRISLVLKAVMAFLSTPLMESVAKAPMLKPPITKTNVLKMDNNFKGAVALYDYIIAYNKPGYSVKTSVNTIAPFRGELAEEMAEVGGLVSFLAYEYGLGLRQSLKTSYTEEEEHIKSEEIRQRAERIEAMKRKLAKSEISAEEYALTLEKQLRDLEGETARADALASAIEKYKETEKHYGEQIAQLESEMEENKHAHFEEMEKLRFSHEDAMHNLIENHDREVEELHSVYGERVQKLTDEAREAEERHRKESEELRESTARELSAMAEECKSSVAQANAVASACREESERVRGELDALLEAKRVLEARIKAIGGVDRDYTDKNSFDELEEEYKAFTRIYKDQWAKTKKQIRKNHLNLKNLKDREESDNSSD